MAYKYTNASMAVSGKSPKNSYIEVFQRTLDDQFYNSSDWWTIKEEYPIKSKLYKDIDVRINHVINAETGLKLGDDWKTVLFKEIDHNIELGKLYSFDENVWLTVNTEVIKNLTGTCTIRRCNNTLRWIDETTGAFYEEPCCIEYLVKEPRDYSTSGSPFMTPGGFLHIELQFNDITNKIKQNQRFLFGNVQHWTCYKVVGTGINDFRNSHTYDKTTASILVLDLIANFVNDELDDIVNGIADVNTNLYAISINKESIQGNINDTVQLSTVVTYNKNTVTRNIVWASSNTKIATVNVTGLVTFKSIGNTTITANIEDNPASSTCTVITTATPAVNSDVVMSPETNYIYEGNKRQYSVYLYENGVAQTDEFTITCNPNTTLSENYIFTQDDENHFTVSNVLREVSSYLTIVCVSGSNSKSFNIYLKGVW